MAKEVLGEEFVKKSHYHNRNITWVPMNKDVYGWTRGGLDRYYGNVWQAVGNRHINGYEVQNI